MGAAHSQAALPPTLSLSLVKHLCGNWYSQISVQVEAAFAIRDEIGEITREEFLKIIEPLVVPCDTPIKWDGYDHDVSRGDTVISTAPVAQTFADFLTPSECKHVIDLAAHQMSQARVMVDASAASPKGAVTAIRNNSLAWLPHDASPLLSAIVTKVSTLIGLPTWHAEKVQVIRYTENQQYNPHFDVFDANTPRGQTALVDGGNRLVTALVYLTPVAVGGSTSFVHLDKLVAPAVGKMLVFHSTHRGTSCRHVDSYHAGSPVVTGEKWAFNLWYRERVTTAGIRAWERGGREGFREWEERWPQLCVMPRGASVAFEVRFVNGNPNGNPNGGKERLRVYWRPQDKACGTTALAKEGLAVTVGGVVVKTVTGQRWDVVVEGSGEVRRRVVVVEGMGDVVIGEEEIS